MEAQRRYGPRCFVPDSLLPKPYCYHRETPASVLKAAAAAEASFVRPTTPPSSSSSAAAAAGAALQAAGGGPRASASSDTPPGPGRASSAEGRAGAAAGTHDAESGSFPAVAWRSSGGGGGAAGGLSTECVICMYPVPLQPSSERLITPCCHFFHEPCLVRWAEVKLECPTCRSRLPPLSS